MWGWSKRIMSTNRRQYPLFNCCSEYHKVIWQDRPRLPSVDTSVKTNYCAAKVLPVIDTISMWMSAKLFGEKNSWRCISGQQVNLVKKKRESFQGLHFENSLRNTLILIRMAWDRLVWIQWIFQRVFQIKEKKMLIMHRRNSQLNLWSFYEGRNNFNVDQWSW